MQGVRLNALSYAFKNGKAQIVKYLIEKAKANITEMYIWYKRYNKTPVEMMCEMGHVQLA